MIKTVIIFQQAVHYVLFRVYGIVLRQGYGSGPFSFISLSLKGRALVQEMPVLPALI